MITTFFRRWWMTRKLHEYIYQRGELIAPLSLLETWPDFDATNTRPQRIQSGVEESNFILYRRWKWEGWWRGFHQEAKPDTWWKKLYFNLSWRKRKREDIEEQWRETIKQCVKLDWIEELPSGRIKLGHEGDSVYVWYYPLVASLGNVYIKAIIIAIIGIVTTYWVSKILGIPPKT